MKHAAPIWLITLAIFSLVVFTAATVLLAGIENTSYDAKDSNGRTMGFNDRLSPEHYAIIVRNFHPRLVVSPRYVFDWGYLATHIMAIGVLATRLFTSKFAKAFFALQLVLLPVALLGAFVFIAAFRSIPTGNADREMFIDVPAFNVLVSAPIWMVISGAALLVIRSRQRGRCILIAASQSVS